MCSSDLPLVGTAEQIVEELGKLADIGVDGCLIFWVRYKEELAQWNEEVLPLMVQAGLRAPFAPAQTSRAAAMQCIGSRPRWRACLCSR